MEEMASPDVLQIRLREGQKEALDEAFFRAQTEGATDAAHLSTWIKGWIVPAAREQAGQSKLELALSEDQDFLSALSRIQERYGVSDVMQALRMAAMAVDRMLIHGSDPFATIPKDVLHERPAWMDKPEDGTKKGG